MQYFLIEEAEFKDIICITLFQKFWYQMEMNLKFNLIFFEKKLYNMLLYGNMIVL